MSCAPYPVAVRLGNVTLPTGQVARGMNMSLGTPPQPIAMLPLWPLNNTLIYGTNGYCLENSPNTGAWTDAACATFRGGAYDLLVTTSRTGANDSAYPSDSAPDHSAGGSSYPAVSRTADALVLNDNLTLDNFPLSVALSDWGPQAYTPMMGLGLGTNSTVLRALQAAGAVASRSYSFFWGQTVAGSSSSSLDGSVVFGGFDRAKIQGSTAQNYTATLSAAERECPSQLLVNVADIALNFPNGTDASLFAGRRTTFQACLTPGLSTLMRLPLAPYINAMMALTDNSIYNLDRSTGVLYWNMRYGDASHAADASPYAGDLTITLQDAEQRNTSVRIANSQLVRAHTEIDQTTGAFRVNTSSPDLALHSLQSTEAGKLPQLGWLFFTAAYLHVNQDTQQFTLWPANPTPRVDLVAVDAQGTETSTFCEPATNATGSVASAGGSGSDDGSGDGGGNGGGNGGSGGNSDDGVPLGVIVGAAVGSAVLLAVAGLVVWCLRRRKIQKRQQASDRRETLQQARQSAGDKFIASTASYLSGTTAGPTPGATPATELDSSVYVPELSTARHTAYYGPAEQKEPEKIRFYELSG